MLPTPGLDREGQRGVVSALVSRRYGALQRLCPHCGATSHGRPRVAGRPELHLSIAYAGGLAVLAVADEPVAVDVEADGAPPAGFADRAAWTRAEAALKLTGEGVRRDPWAPGPAGVAVRPVDDLPAGYVGSLATWSDPSQSGRSGSSTS